MRRADWPYPLLMPILLVLCLAAPVQASGSERSGPLPSIEDKQPPRKDLDITAGEFRRLRAVRGHFQGGRWNPDVDSWNGRKHQAMMALGARFGKMGVAAAAVTRSMGEPDLRVCRGGPGYPGLMKKLSLKQDSARASCYLVYYWRGPRDFLYFAVQDEVITRSGWRYAGE